MAGVIELKKTEMDDNLLVRGAFREERKSSNKFLKDTVEKSWLWL